MDLASFYQRLIVPPAPWRVCRVEVDDAGRRVDVWIEHAPGWVFACAVCGAPLPVSGDWGRSRATNWP